MNITRIKRWFRKEPENYPYPEYSRMTKRGGRFRVRGADPTAMMKLIDAIDLERSLRDSSSDEIAASKADLAYALILYGDYIRKKERSLQSILNLENEIERNWVRRLDEATSDKSANILHDPSP